MLFEEALAAARAGQKVRSLKWTPGTYFALSESPECPQDPRKFFWLYQNYGAHTRLVPWGDLHAWFDDEFEIYEETSALQMVRERVLRTHGSDTLFGMLSVQEKLLTAALDIIQEEIATTNPLSFSSSIKDLVSAFRATILNSVHQWEAKI